MSSGIRLLLLFMLLLLSGAAGAQTFEVPNVEYPNNLCELRGDNRVFVNAPLSTRQKIVKELRGHSGLFVVERPEEADFMLLFTYTPFADDSMGGNPPDASGALASRAELTVVKFVNRGEEQVRPRILFYWSEQNSFHNVPLPLKGVSAAGFAAPRSGKGAAAELVARLALWAIHKKWPRTFYFDQFSNQLTISTGGRLEVKGAQAFLKELNNARSNAYALRCVSKPSPPANEGAIPAATTPLLVIPDPTRAAETLPDESLRLHPPAENVPPLREGRPRSVKNPKKGHANR